MRKALVCLGLCLSLLLAGMPGQTPAPGTNPSQPATPSPPPAVVAAFLELSAAQVDQLQALLGPFLETLRKFEEQKQTRLQALPQLVNAPDPNPQAIGELVLQIHALEQQEAQAIQSFQQAFLSLLAPEQSQKVQAVAQAAQLVPVVDAFQALHLVGPPSPPPAAQSMQRPQRLRR